MTHVSDAGDAAAADEEALGSSSESGRRPSKGGFTGADRSSPGAWKDIGEAVGKKYLEAFKSRNALTYHQVYQMLCSL